MAEEQSDKTGNLSRDNHFVSRALLKRWSDDGKNVFVYQTLVSDLRVPTWQTKSTRGVAVRRDLYTSFDGDDEHDNFEQWLSNEIEQPGLEASEKLIRGERLRADDWRNLIKLLAAQEVRTPQSFFEFMGRWDRELPELLETQLKEAKKYLETPPSNRPTLIKKPPDEEFARIMDFKIHRGEKQAIVDVQIIAGRQLWIWAMRHVLTGRAIEKLLRQRWSILEPFGNEEWPLTDQPSLRLNYHDPSKYDFGGGWGRRGCDVMMPLSPRHLMYTQVGKKHPRRETAAPETTFEIQRILVERSHRLVFATKPNEWIPKAKPRLVDPELCAYESALWESWHDDQMRAETDRGRRLDTSPARTVHSLHNRIPSGNERD